MIPLILLGLLLVILVLSNIALRRQLDDVRAMELGQRCEVEELRKALADQADQADKKAMKVATALDAKREDCAKLQGMVDDEQARRIGLQKKAQEHVDSMADVLACLRTWGA